MVRDDVKYEGQSSLGIIGWSWWCSVQIDDIKSLEKAGVDPKEVVTCIWVLLTFEFFDALENDTNE